MQWRSTPHTNDEIFGMAHDDAAYAAGWTISGVATLAAIVAVWIFGI